MSNYIEYNDKIAFHPGYYIKEIIDESGLTQEDFAKRLDTTPKNLSLLVRGKQNLSVDIAMKLSRMLGTSMEYWLNLQNAYDSLTAEFKAEKEMVEERRIFEYLDYKYFKDNYGLPAHSRQIVEQIRELRKFLNISSLRVLTRKDLSVSFRNAALDLSEASTVRANAMVQIAINQALKVEAPQYDKKRFEKAIEYALTLTENHTGFYPLICESFRNAGVIFIILPNISGSKTNGATKQIGNNIMLMVNDRRLNADSFWFTLFHEIGHIVNGDYGISFERETGKQEEEADKYAEDHLIPPMQYEDFLAKGKYDLQAIKKFAEKINRDPGIVVGRLQNDGVVDYNDWTLKTLRNKYKVQR